jgi:leucyl-tRNA synthetase
VKRPLKQWLLRITAYAERLLTDLELLDWPESIKAQQREWIGRSEGAEIEFALEGLKERLTVFTTRPDTLWGATFVVVAPEHPLVGKLATAADRAAVRAYVKQAAAKSDLERTDLAREKTGVFTGRYALNPLMDPGHEEARLPVFVADYVLASYGHGAIMAVPAHDERDFEFARAHNLAIREVVLPPRGVKGLAEGACFPGEGTAVHSGPLDGLKTPAAKKRALELLVEKKAGRARVQYKLRDWLFSRQRYWGEPFPLLYEADGSITLVPSTDLPVTLPELEDFRPSADGSAPLARAKDWLTVASPRTKRPARRDTDTMPGWAGSCWYWLRFMDPGNARAPFAPEAEQYWGPVDLYVGGAAHAVMHLLYARFWHKVLFDVGLVSTREPFQRLFNQGLITAFAFKDATGRLVPNAEVEEKGGKATRKGTGDELEAFVTKMAKSLGNVVNPDQVIGEYGADTLRVYMMFMGPLSESKPWNPRDIAGSRRFLERVWRLIVEEQGEPIRPELHAFPGGRPEGPALGLERALNRMLERVNDSFESFAFNTAVAVMMEFVNEATRQRATLRRDQAERFLRALSPFAPHLADELWAALGHREPIQLAGWPAVDPAYLVDDEIELVVQVNGKLRAKIRAPKDALKERLEELGRAAVTEHLAGKTVKKVVVVPGRLVNFVGE